jgi:rSAM/selenodomain-associated transferase 1
MAKYPQPGTVKTRLARALGPERACRLHEAFLLDLRDRLRRAGLPVTWAVWPPGADVSALLPGETVVAQEGADLGERMDRAATLVAAGAREPVVVLGTDVPHVPLAWVRRAAREIEWGRDVVLGPARDGGYYLVAYRPPCPVLFADVPWGSAEVLATTVARCAAAGLGLGLLPELFDVDVAADLDSLRAWCRARPGALPRTRLLLAAATG